MCVILLYNYRNYNLLQNIINSSCSNLINSVREMLIHSIREILINSVRGEISFSSLIVLFFTRNGITELF